MESDEIKKKKKKKEEKIRELLTKKGRKDEDFDLTFFLNISLQNKKKIQVEMTNGVLMRKNAYKHTHKCGSTDQAEHKSNEIKRHLIEKSSK